MKVGDKIKLLVDVREEGEDLPPGIIAYRGEVLIVRRVGDERSAWPLYVSHEHIKDRSFGVNLPEFENATD